MATFERSTLSNGTRVLTAGMSHAQSVSCFLMYAAGSRYEQREEGGIAHFAEHMLFKGTERRPTARDIATEIDTIGGEFNAFTGKELTGYYVKCAAETRDVALDVLVDMLRNSRFDAEEIDREKGVIVEEMNMYADTPRSYVGNVWERHLYGDQPLGWDVIGARSYPHGHPDRYAVQLLSTVLGGGMSSRLFTEVRERRGLAYYVFCANNSYADAGALAAQAGVDLNRIDEAIETIVAELRRAAAEPVPTDELEKARSFAKGRFVLGLESPHATIMFGLRREILEGRAAEPTEVLEGLDAVTVEDVERVAADVLGGELRLA